MTRQQRIIVALAEHGPMRMRALFAAIGIRFSAQPGEYRCYAQRLLRLEKLGRVGKSGTHTRQVYALTELGAATRFTERGFIIRDRTLPKGANAYPGKADAAKKRRNANRDANRCINSPKPPRPAHGPIYKGGRCQTCWDIKTKTTSRRDTHEPPLRALPTLLERRRGRDPVPGLDAAVIADGSP